MSSISVPESVEDAVRYLSIYFRFVLQFIVFQSFLQMMFCQDGDGERYAELTGLRLVRVMAYASNARFPNAV